MPSLSSQKNHQREATFMVYFLCHNTKYQYGFKIQNKEQQLGKCFGRQIAIIINRLQELGGGGAATHWAFF